MRLSAIVVLCLIGTAGLASAESCPGNPDALGTGRTITVDPAAWPRIGTMQYRRSLPLKDHEVVITFDDGPLPPYTNRILDILKANCVKATYFLVGRMARAYPGMVRRIYNEGHTVGTHSQNHPFAFNDMGLARIAHEVDGGIATVKAAIGDARAVSPFFRIPGLARGRQVERFLAAQALTVWSADEVADDWIRGVGPAAIARRAINRIEARHHRGVLLLHDIHPATVLALPLILKELKARGYSVVHVVAPGERPPSVPELSPAVAENGGWPRVTKAGLSGPALKSRVKAALAGKHGAGKHRHAKKKDADTIDYVAAALDRQQATY